ncbi:Restriction endonuclease NaeI [Bryocella elongata]|uniref:Restriction endonuclease NaeI n=1 Tax=Bryocella elongata TaxID=863522 RepID=A0A1H5XLZ4_9BACT|nr:NaeI family type II restriction endonuclease [Bryocella elongata]SEG12768.1 Restriction endonuclease NaeI [Bryocella elongata]
MSDESTAANTPWRGYVPKSLPEGFNFPATHQDYELMCFLHEEILRLGGGWKQFCAEVPTLIRRAIDEVIDTGRSGRFLIDELEKTEKTYIGTKVEILLRNYLGAPWGKLLDLNLRGVEVDIKNTVTGTWYVPPEAFGRPCIVVSADEVRSTFSIGIIVARPEILNKGNQDKKRSISARGIRENAHWLLRDYPYPPNFWQQVPVPIREAILSSGKGTKRVAALFRKFMRQPIPKKVAVGLAQQEDPMRRIRKGGGARDEFVGEGIVLLSGQYDRALIHELGLPVCARDEFISIKAATSAEEEILKRGKKI